MPMTAPRPGLAPRNANDYRHPFGRPVVQVASTALPELQAMAASIERVRIVSTFRFEDTLASNVTGVVAGTDPTAAPACVHYSAERMVELRERTQRWHRLLAPGKQRRERPDRGAGSGRDSSVRLAGNWGHDEVASVAESGRTSSSCPSALNVTKKTPGGRSPIGCSGDWYPWKREPTSVGRDKVPAVLVETAEPDAPGLPASGLLLDDVPHVWRDLEPEIAESGVTDPLVCGRPATSRGTTFAGRGRHRRRRGGWRRCASDIRRSAGVTARQGEAQRACNSNQPGDRQAEAWQAICGPHQCTAFLFETCQILERSLLFGRIARGSNGRNHQERRHDPPDAPDASRCARRRSGIVGPIFANIWKKA